MFTKWTVTAVVVVSLLAWGPVVHAQQARPASGAAVAQAPAMQQPAGSAAGQKSLAEMLSRFPVVEQDGRKVVKASLKDILSIALERNIALGSVRLGETIAQSALDAARERLNPTLTNKASFGRALSPSSSGSPSDFLDLSRSEAITLSSSLAKKDDLGITYGLTYNETRSRAQLLSIPSEGDSPTSLGSTDWVDSSALTGSVTVPLSQGFGRAYNNIPVRRAEVGVLQSREAIHQQELQLLTTIASTYWDLVGAQETVTGNKEAVKLSEQLLKDNQVRLEAGVLSPTDVQVTETQLARDRQQLLSSQVDVARIEDQVRALLNLENLDYGFLPTDVPQVQKGDFRFDRLIKSVYKNDPTLRQLEASKQSNALDLQEAQEKEKANLNLDMYYTFNGYSSTPFKGVTDYTQTETGGYGAALTWTVPLFDRVTPETIRQRTLQGRQLILQEDSQRSTLAVSLQATLRQLHLAQRSVETAGVARRLSDEQLKNEIERFRLGQSTSFQVSQAQQQATAARINEILARVNFEKTYLNLLDLTGDLYRHYGLKPTIE